MEEIREKLTEAHRLTAEARMRLEELARRVSSLRAELADATAGVGAPPIAAPRAETPPDGSMFDDLPPIPKSGAMPAAAPPPLPADALTDFDDVGPQSTQPRKGNLP